MLAINLAFSVHLEDQMNPITGVGHPLIFTPAQEVLPPTKERNIRHAFTPSLPMLGEIEVFKV